MIFEKTRTRISWQTVELYVNCTPTQVGLSQVNSTFHVRESSRLLNDFGVCLEQSAIHTSAHVAPHVIFFLNDSHETPVPPSPRQPDSSGIASATGAARFASPTPSPRHLRRHHSSRCYPSIPAAISSSSRTLSPSSSSDDTRRRRPAVVARIAIAANSSPPPPPGAGSAADAARFTSSTPSPCRPRRHRHPRHQTPPPAAVPLDPGADLVVSSAAANASTPLPPPLDTVAAPLSPAAGCSTARSGRWHGSSRFRHPRAGPSPMPEREDEAPPPPSLCPGSGEAKEEGRGDERR
uniref:Uncharacterized protein n=1 Tax=Oryza barthii TaxID=65489 RepID=A0A0D3GG62_9ORYZ